MSKLFFLMKNFFLWNIPKNVFYTHSINFYIMEFFESNFYNVTLLLDIHTCTCTLYLCIALTTRSCYGGRAVRELFPSACRALQTSHVYCTVVHTKKMGHSWTREQQVPKCYNATSRVPIRVLKNSIGNWVVETPSELEKERGGTKNTRIRSQRSDSWIKLQEKKKSIVGGREV